MEALWRVKVPSTHQQRGSTYAIEHHQAVPEKQGLQNINYETAGGTDVETASQELVTFLSFIKNSAWMFSVFCVYIYVNKITTRREREAAGSEYKYTHKKRRKNIMTEIRKINGQELENVAGGEGYNYDFNSGWRTVKNIQSGYLAIRTAPTFAYENEVIHKGPTNGQKVQITGSTVQGTGINGVPATYVWVYSPDFGVSGYVNTYFLG